MKRLLVLMFSIALFGSCNTEKTFSKQIKYDWDINYTSSKYDDHKRQYDLKKNLKSGYVQNQTEAQASIPRVKSNQEFLASKDKVVTSVLVNNYSHKKLPQINLNKRIIESFKKKSPIINNKKTPLKKPNTKDKIKKIFKIIVTLILITLTALICLLTGVVIAWDGITGFSFILLLTSALFLFFSYRAVLKIIKTYSKKNKDDYRDSVD
tara:strand:- start:89 stop:715 length:627 start_codon:yes stop_codon:yes gene_type:complete